MADAPADGGDETTTRDPRAEDATDGLAELRALLVGPEQAQLGALEARLDDPARRTAEVSDVLADAIARRGKDPHLGRALSPAIEDAITASVRRNPRPLADAIFPIIGPAIRKAIAHTLSAMMESFNRTLELGLSWRALRWRLTALRTGKSFAEIVLLHTLVYRVEQVFLIHRETGLLLLHAAADPRTAQDADQVSAMLTAIRDFVHDSFGGQAGETLDALRVGELSVYAEQGPHAVLAGVVRGTPPRELRVGFAEALESIHLQHGADLESFNGDAAPFESARPILEDCLRAAYHAPKAGVKYGRWSIAAAAVLLAALWAWSSFRDSRQWQAYVDRLQATPGIVVVEAGRRAGRHFIVGLRDPLAPDPVAILAASGIPADRVDGRWELYQALDPALVLARAHQVLRPPSGVTLRLDDGTLVAAGSAPARWIADTNRLAPTIPGITRYDGARLAVADMAALRAQIQDIAPRFEKGSTRLAPGQDAAVRRLAALLGQLDALAQSLGTRVGVDIMGHTDTDGSAATNMPLSQARADAVLAWIGAGGRHALEITARGVGGTMPLAAGTTEADKQRNRRVSVRVSAPDLDEARRP